LCRRRDAAGRSMKLSAIALDYDGTIAVNGRLDGVAQPD
jgi:hypothetical protein